MMSKEDAKAISGIVATDSEASKRIDSYIDDVIPAAWGISGSIRNFGYTVLGMITLNKHGDPSDKEYADRVCTGISSASAAAINAAVKAGDARLRRVSSASTISRVLNGTDHEATSIQMVDKQEHVFDWHATLDALNPLMYRTIGEWMKGKNGITLDNFNGWK